MVRRGGDRSSLVIAFGGGVVDDVAGFLAAIFMRGIPVIQIPTTLLAQVDAGVGGKTGVNLVAGKNLIGAFHQPLAVLTDPDVLATLPEREYRAGLYEVIKCGVIRSPVLFRLMSERQSDVLARDSEIVEKMIAESVRIKAEVVSADEREGDLRRILNFGHTYGHALEAETGYSAFCTAKRSRSACAPPSIWRGAPAASRRTRPRGSFRPSPSTARFHRWAESPPRTWSPGWPATRRHGRARCISYCRSGSARSRWSPASTTRLVLAAAQAALA